MGGAELQSAHRDFGDLICFSAVTYTSLGFGDVIPTGAMREFSAWRP